MASAVPSALEEPGPPPSSRWRVSLTVVILVVTAVLIIAAIAFPPRPPPTGGGAPPCPTCYSFSLVAGIAGTLTFNGTVPGPALTVPWDAQVTMKLIVDAAAAGPQSWMLVPSNGTPSSPVVFPGANTTDPTVGTAPGSSQTVTFTASTSGSYKYLCGVDSHYLEGMWGYFNVTA